MALDGLGEKLKSFFKPKEDPRFKGHGRRLGNAETHTSAPRPHQLEPSAAEGVRAASRTAAVDANAPAEAACSPLKPPPQPLGPGGRTALVVSRSHRTEDVVLDAAVMANTPTGKEAHLVSAHRPAGAGGAGRCTPSHLGPGSSPSQSASPPPAYPVSPSAPQAAGPCSPTTACGAGGARAAGSGAGGLTVEVPRTSGGGRAGVGGGGHAAAVGSVGHGRGSRQSRTEAGVLGSMVSTISTPTAAEKRMGGFRCPAPPTDGAMADYGLAPATSQAYELQRCLALVLSSRPISNSNLTLLTSTASSSAAAPSTATAAAAAAAATPQDGSPLDPLASSSLSSRSLTETEAAAGSLAATAAAAVAEPGADTAAPSAPAVAGPSGAGDGGAGAGGAAEGGAPAAEGTVAAAAGVGPRECCEALLRVLRNVLTRPEEPKFRQIRLSNPRVQETLVAVPGAVEFLEAAGFRMRFSPEDGSDTANQGFLVLPDEVPSTALAEAFRILSAVMAAHGFASPRPSPGPGPSPGPTIPAGGTMASAQPPPPPPRQSIAPAMNGVAAAAAAPAVDRCTQVLLPAAPDVTVPDWFFERTGAEIREQWAAMLRKREEAERFMTRTMREVRRQQQQQQQETEAAALSAAAAAGGGGGGGGGSANVATVRVRFPEGVCLQGQFGAAEPVSRVFEWVAGALRSPTLTFELIKPDRRPLETTATAGAGATAKSGAASRPAGGGGGAGPVVPLTVRGAQLLPSVLLNLRPTGRDAAALAAANMPLLSDELLRTTKPQ